MYLHMKLRLDSLDEFKSNSSRVVKGGGLKIHCISFVGSNPTCCIKGPIAQLVRASVLYAEGHGFKPHWVHFRKVYNFNGNNIIGSNPIIPNRSIIIILTNNN